MSTSVRKPFPDLRTRLLVARLLARRAHALESLAADMALHEKEPGYEGSPDHDREEQSFQNAFAEILRVANAYPEKIL